MLDWLRRDHQHPSVEVSGRTLPIAIRRHPRARRLTMRLAPDGSELRISMPQWGRTLDALTFANARSEWIARQLAKVPQPVVLEDGTALPFCGEQLTLRWNPAGPRKVRREGGSLHAGGPEELLASRLRRWLESEALALLQGDLADYCARARLPQPELRLSRALRRWGSCSSERRKNGSCIRINWRLVMAPPHVRRSVVAHEVAHLTHFDHSPAFYAELARLYEGDLAVADGWLKAEGRGLYALFG